MPSTRGSLISQIRDLDAATGWVECDRLYRPLLTWYARSRGLDQHEAEEITQQCLEVIVSKIGAFQRRSSFRGWLRQIVDNKVKQYFSRHRKERQARTDVFTSVADTEPSPAQAWENQWEKAHLLYCLSHLRGEFAKHTIQAFELYVLRELPVKEIAEMLSMTPNQIYVAKSRVVRRLVKTNAELTETLYGTTT